jgi:hypothetical protein
MFIEQAQRMKKAEDEAVPVSNTTKYEMTRARETF